MRIHPKRNCSCNKCRKKREKREEKKAITVFYLLIFGFIIVCLFI